MLDFSATFHTIARRVSNYRNLIEMSIIRWASSPPTCDRLAPGWCPPFLTFLVIAGAGEWKYLFHLLKGLPESLRSLTIQLNDRIDDPSPIQMEQVTAAINGLLLSRFSIKDAYYQGASRHFFNMKIKVDTFELDTNHPIWHLQSMQLKCKKFHLRLLANKLRHPDTCERILDTFKNICLETAVILSASRYFLKCLEIEKLQKLLKGRGGYLVVDDMLY